MSTKKLQTSRRNLLKGTAATAAIAPFFIGRSAKAEDVITWKGSTVAPKNTPWQWLASKLSGELEEQTGGAIKMKIIYGGGAGGEKQTLLAAADGRMHVWAGTGGAVAATVAPELGAFELPYLMPSNAAASKALDATRTLVHDILWDAGFKLAMYSTNTFRELGTTFEVNTPADLKGKKIRVQESDIHKNLFEAWGASPVQMSVTEVLSSLQTGVIDGADNSKLFAQAAGQTMAMTHWANTQHIYQAGLILISRKGAWDKLPTEIQKSIDVESEAMMKLQSRGRRRVEGLDAQLKQNLIDLGLKVSEPDLGPWRAVAGEVRKKWRASATKKGVALLDAIEKAI